LTDPGASEPLLRTVKYVHLITGHVSNTTIKDEWTGTGDPPARPISSPDTRRTTPATLPCPPTVTDARSRRAAPTALLPAHRARRPTRYSLCATLPPAVL
jgi:hypothetical protein